jgi:hypothetical protein
MPIQADWDNDTQTVIRIHAHDPWTIEEYSQATLQAYSMMESLTACVHVIIDFTDAYSFPKNMLSGASGANVHIHPRQGLVVIVKISPYLRAVIKATLRVFPRLKHNVFFTQTVQEAYTLIQTMPVMPRL